MINCTLMIYIIVWCIKIIDLDVFGLGLLQSIACIIVRISVSICAFVKLIAFHLHLVAFFKPVFSALLGYFIHFQFVIDQGWLLLWIYVLFGGFIGIRNGIRIVTFFEAVFAYGIYLASLLRITFFEWLQQCRIDSLDCV